MGHHGGMTEGSWDGYRIVDANTGETVFRVRDDRICDARTGSTEYRIRDGERVVGASGGQLVFRIRDDGRVVNAIAANSVIASETDSSTHPDPRVTDSERDPMLAFTSASGAIQQSIS